VPLGQLPFPTPGWRDLLEILIVAYVAYTSLRFLVGTRALQIVFGRLVLQPELRQALARLGQTLVLPAASR
jgi:DNA integrity scanning protein DisA with diadenylate cyclase activity